MKNEISAIRETKEAMKEFGDALSELRPYHVLLLILLSICSIAVTFGCGDLIRAATSNSRIETISASEPVETTTTTTTSATDTSETIMTAELEPDIENMTSLEEIASAYDVDVCDLRTLCQVAIGEAVGDGERSVQGVIHVVVNAANQWRNGDIYDEVFGGHNRYSCVEDGKSYCWVGEVTDEVIFREDCKWVIPLAVKVLLKEEPDITDGALYYVAYKGLGYTLDEFLDANHIEGFVILGTQVFFKDWPDTLN